MVLSSEPAQSRGRNSEGPSIKTGGKMEKKRVLGLARRSGRKQAIEEKEERMGIQHAWEIEETMRE